MNEPTSVPKPESSQPDTAAVLRDSAFPTEPFACPACGQMLSPACRVCVACKQPIDFAVVNRKESATPTPELPRATIIRARARFSWPIFLVVLIPTWISGALALRYLGLEKAQLLIIGIQLTSSAWVFYDAHTRRIPRPLRWSLGSLLLWILIFPWYVSRRRTPEALCPFVEAEVGPVTRFLLVILLTVILVSLVAFMVATMVGK